MKRTPHTPTYDSNKYVEFRPTYPEGLFNFIFSFVKSFELAWDCGCGNGQATLPLAKHFKRVIATDISETQIAASIQYPNVHYYVASADNVPIEDHSLDLVTVAQAMHWFSNDDFFKEVKRVLKPRGVLAAWCYDLPMINQQVTEILNYLAYTILDSYWAPGRKYIQSKYSDIPFPFKKIYCDHFYGKKEFDYAGFIGYLESWSSRYKYIKETDKDPLDLVKKALLDAWGDPKHIYHAKYPIYCVLGSPTSGFPK